MMNRKLKVDRFTFDLKITRIDAKIELIITNVLLDGEITSIFKGDGSIVETLEWNDSVGCDSLYEIFKNISSLDIYLNKVREGMIRLSRWTEKIDNDIERYGDYLDTTWNWSNKNDQLNPEFKQHIKDTDTKYYWENFNK
jgi:hypothetical protein